MEQIGSFNYDNADIFHKVMKSALGEILDEKIIPILSQISSKDPASITKNIHQKSMEKSLEEFKKRVIGESSFDFKNKKHNIPSQYIELLNRTSQKDSILNQVRVRSTGLQGVTIPKNFLFRDRTIQETLDDINSEKLKTPKNSNEGEEKQTKLLVRLEKLVSRKVVGLLSNTLRKLSEGLSEIGGEAGLLAFASSASWLNEKSGNNPIVKTVTSSLLAAYVTIGPMLGNIIGGAITGALNLWFATKLLKGDGPLKGFFKGIPKEVGKEVKSGVKHGLKGGLRGGILGVITSIILGMLDDKIGKGLLDTILNRVLPPNLYKKHKEYKEFQEHYEKSRKPWELWKESNENNKWLENNRNKNSISNVEILPHENSVKFSSVRKNTENNVKENNKYYSEDIPLGGLTKPSPKIPWSVEYDTSPIQKLPLLSDLGTQTSTLNKGAFRHPNGNTELAQAVRFMNSQMELPT